MTDRSEGAARLAPASWASPAVAGLTVLLLALLTNIFERKEEARQPFVRLVEVTEDDTDPQGVGPELAARSTTATSGPRCRPRPSTAAAGRGSDALPGRAEDRARPVAQAHVRGLRVLDRLPRPARPRLHARRPGADAARDQAAAAGRVPALPRLDHAALPRRSAKGDVMKGFEAISGDAVRRGARHEGRHGPAARSQHPVSCVDCHDPKTMELRVTRPGFIARHQAALDDGRAQARGRASPTTRTATRRGRRCARSSAASATSSTTAGPKQGR